MDDFLLKPEMRSWFCCKPHDPKHLLMKKIEIQLTTNRPILLGGFNCVPLETIETNLECKETHVHLEKHQIVILRLGIKYFIKLGLKLF